MDDISRLLSMKDKDGKAATFKDPNTGDEIQVKKFVESILKTSTPEKIVIGLFMASAIYIIIMCGYHPVRNIITAIIQ